MKQVYLNILFSNDSPFSIGMVSQSNEMFYGEFSDFHDVLPDGIVFKFDPPPLNQDEHWMWSLNNNVEMRGTKKELSTNITDWFHSILGGVALSWVDYSESMGGPGYRNIKPVADTPEIIIGTMTYNEWKTFYDMFNSFPKCVANTPIYVDALTDSIKDHIPPLDTFRDLYHRESSEFNPIDNCKVLISYITTAKRVKESQK